jgi:hypothetical protein
LPCMTSLQCAVVYRCRPSFRCRAFSSVRSLPCGDPRKSVGARQRLFFRSVGMVYTLVLRWNCNGAWFVFGLSSVVARVGKRRLWLAIII